MSLRGSKFTRSRNNHHGDTMENIKAGDAVKVNLPDWFYFGQVVRVNSKTITVKSYDYKREATGPARRIPTYMVKQLPPVSERERFAS